MVKQNVKRAISSRDKRLKKGHQLIQVMLTPQASKALKAMLPEYGRIRDAVNASIVAHKAVICKQT